MDKDVNEMGALQAVISPWWAHSLQLWLLALLPEAVSVKFLDWQHQAAGVRGAERCVL